MNNDKLLGILALALGAALAWIVFEPVMAATAARGVSIDVVKAAAGLLLGILLGWEVVARLRR